MLIGFSTLPLTLDFPENIKYKIFNLTDTEDLLKHQREFMGIY